VSITREEFHETLGPDGPPGPHPRFHEEREWWKSDDRLGVIIRDKIDDDWSWVNMAIDPFDGKWRCCDLAAGAKSQDEARMALHLSMIGGGSE